MARVPSWVYVVTGLGFAIFFGVAVLGVLFYGYVDMWLPITGVGAVASWLLYKESERREIQRRRNAVR